MVPTTSRTVRFHTPESLRTLPATSLLYDERRVGLLMGERALASTCFRGCADHGSHARLGKRPARHDPRTLRLARYVAPGFLPKPPDTVDWTQKLREIPMYGNDRLGDCTCAAAAHMVSVWTSAGEHREVDLPEERVLEMYAAVSGYDPHDPSSDRGAVVLDVLNHWRKVGVGGSNAIEPASTAHRIGAYAAVSPRDAVLVRDAVHLFGGLYVGLELPLSAQGQEVWDVGSDWSRVGPTETTMPGSWGGHAVPVVGYDARFLIVATWGALLPMTWAFFAAYCDEAYAVLSEDFLLNGRAPNGFRLSDLRRDLALL